MLTTFDAPFYMSLARDLVEGTYSPVDTHRAVPDFAPRPVVPPLLSCIAALLNVATPFSMPWIAAVLPTVLGSFIAVPLFALGRFYGGTSIGVTAGLFAVFSPLYAYRTGFGWFDTDCLNVTWTLLILYFLLRFAVETSVRRYAYFCAAITSAGLFIWWWDQAEHAVVAISAMALVLSLVLHYRPKRREGLIFLGRLRLRSNDRTGYARVRSACAVSTIDRRVVGVHRRGKEGSVSEHRGVGARTGRGKSSCYRRPSRARLVPFCNRGSGSHMVRRPSPS